MSLSTELNEISNALRRPLHIDCRNPALMPMNDYPDFLVNFTGRFYPLTMILHEGVSLLSDSLGPANAV